MIPPFPHDLNAAWIAGTSSVPAFAAETGVQVARLASSTPVGVAHTTLKKAKRIANRIWRLMKGNYSDESAQFLMATISPLAMVLDAGEIERQPMC